MKCKEKYYYIKHLDIVGKGCDFHYQIFRDGRWVRDEKSLIMDRLMGFDPSEPPDSPYGIGSLDVMDELAEISEGEAMEIIRRQQERR